MDSQGCICLFIYAFIYAFIYVFIYVIIAKMAMSQFESDWEEEEREHKKKENEINSVLYLYFKINSFLNKIILKRKDSSYVV